MSVGEKIKITRNIKGLSTNDLARLTEISQSTISKLENGKRSPDLTLIRKIADALECSIDYLVSDKESKVIRSNYKEDNPVEEKLIFKKEAPPIKEGWRPITVSETNYKSIKLIADETNMPISKVAGMLIEFALENVVIE